MVKLWWQAFRPKTLSAAIVPVGVGTALVVAMQYAIQWRLSVFALVGALFIQIGTNLFNDALDFKHGTDNAERLGPRRVTQAGIFTYKQVMWAGVLSFAAAFACGIPLIMAAGWPLLVVGLISLACGYAYTGGPYPLAYKGLGDVFVLIFFGWVAVMTTYYLHSHAFDVQSFVVGTQIGLLSCALIAINNLRDIEGDALNNKRTLAVRFGKRFARFEILACCFLPHMLGYAWWTWNFKWAAILPLLSLPVALWIVRDVYKYQPGEFYNMLLARCALLHVSFGILLCIGLLL